MVSGPTLDRSTTIEDVSTTWSVPWRRLVGVSLLVGWLPMAIAKVLYGGMGDFSQFDLIAANPGRLIAGGLVSHFGAILLIPAIVGMVCLARARARTLTTIGALLAIAIPVAIGGVSELHLVGREFARPGLDRAAMTEFVARFDDMGAWGVPVMLLLVGMTFGLPLLAIALRRAQVISIVPVIVILVHIPVHFLWADTLSHFILAAALTMVGLRVLRMTDAEWSARITSERSHHSGGA
jgi:hypothetical protein